MIQDQLLFPSRVRLLYYNLVESTTPFNASPPHLHHDHWQLEIALRGAIYSTIDGRKITLNPGMAVLIPPGIRHEFHYPPLCRAFVSIKFQPGDFFNRLPWGVVENTPAATYFRDEIQRLADRAATRDNDAILEHLLAALFELHYRHTAPSVPKLLRRIDEAILPGPGRHVSVKSVAARLGYSPTHLCRITRHSYGVSLKEYIDRKLYALACRHLKYSERNISEIAAELGFTDIYTFSRFFSRMNHGEPPSRFRHSQNLSHPLPVDVVAPITFKENDYEKQP